MTDSKKMRPTMAGIDDKVAAMQTGIERQRAAEAQAKLQQRRWERDHFSDGVPVAMYEGFEPSGVKPWEG